MKRWISIILLVCICQGVLLSACDDSHQEKASSDQTQTRPESKTTDTQQQGLGDKSEKTTDPNLGGTTTVEEFVFNENKTGITIAPVTSDASKTTPYMPYQNIFNGGKALNLQIHPGEDPLQPCVIQYKKREGGKYLYSNNPEKLAPEDIGAALLREENMSGVYEFTFEHSNFTGSNIFLGFQLYNEGKEDVSVTVSNIGYQVKGEWLGQQSWSDFYNLKFELPEDYFVDGEENWYYKGQDFLDYTPRVYQPTTYTIPAGQYIWVIGGTSNDAYNRTDVADTADKQVQKGKCSNGSVKFDIHGTNVTGTFYAYQKADQIAGKPAEQGYVTTRNDINYGAQYKGVDDHLGLIEADIHWVVNDLTQSGRLPVTYETSYDRSAQSNTAPYASYSNKQYTIKDKEWLTSLNPQSAHRAIGTDMMTFACVDTDGVKRIIDNNRADGRGQPANTGNWMVQYNDNFTFVNTGTKPRTFTIYEKGSVSGALIVAVRDKYGKVLDSKLKAQPILHENNLPGSADSNQYIKKGTTYWPVINGRTYDQMVDERSKVYSITVPANSVSRITVEFLILGNSCGGVEHWVELE